MRPPIRYVSVEGERIAYQVLGSGPVDIVWVFGTDAHLDFQWDLPQQAEQFEDLASFSRLILFDRRGGGLSDRPARILTPDERTDDIRAVMDAVASERAYVFGVSEGGSVALLYAVLRPERTLGLVVWGCRPRWIRAAEYPWGPTEEEFERSLERQQLEDPTTWDFASPQWQRWAGASASDPSVQEWCGRLRRGSLSPAGSAMIRRMNRLIDLRPLLGGIRVPTLILAREDDPVMPQDLARDLAARIPGAELIVYPGQGHLTFDVWPDMCARIRELTTGETIAPVSHRLLTTLLFADLVDSTALASRIGDAAFRSLLERYYSIVRRQLAGFRGIEIDQAGDGFFAHFDGPARAVSFARALRREAATIGLPVRVGIHTGEVEPSGAQLRGIAVHIGARIAASAQAGEVLVSGTVRDLLFGVGFQFQDRGPRTLKGITEPQRVFALAN